MRLHAALLALSLLAVPGRAALADEGMWTFDNFPKAAVKEKHGVEITDAWLKHVRLASVRLAGGCSGSFVSAGGLVMTNYHCAVGCVKDASTKDKDYQVDGFYAKSEDKEIACPEIEVNQLLDIADVTSRVKGATKDLEGAAFIKAQRAEMGLIEKSCSEENTYRCDVVPLYHGGLYHLYKYRTYRDVKLVFVPERDSAFFGGDPDNFNFPRYNLDLAFLRVYEGGKPAATGDHFTWSASGAKEGEAIFTPGNPGGTDRLLTVAQLEYARDVQYPSALLRLSELRGILEQFGKIGAEEKRVSQDQLLLIENAIKVQRGEFEAILDRKLFDATGSRPIPKRRGSTARRGTRSRRRRRGSGISARRSPSWSAARDSPRISTASRGSSSAAPPRGRSRTARGSASTATPPCRRSSSASSPPPPSPGSCRRSSSSSRSRSSARRWAPTIRS
jgi:hypothetical protein